jgi:alkanesulfonate monooxygenase SsuD/methylene tetrahydromethanopterin reductase-like flavin-dependent oxidoreductase (luciferase family)
LDVGLYFDLRNPPAWQQDWRRVYGLTLEQCEEAERLGAGSIWVTEHHLFDDGYLPQPLTFLAALAARTTRIRLGTAILLAALHHPVEIAEQAAVVDILSGGRLELGLGAGYRIPEYELFGADHARRGPVTFARVAELRELWAGGRVTPPPVQQPVPIWVGAGSETTARRTGRLGAGLLRIDPALAAAYREGLAEGGHDPAAGRVAGPANVFLSEDPERDRGTVAKHVAYQWSSYARYGAEGTGRPAPPPVDGEEWLARGIREGLTGAGFLFGTPEHVAAELRAFAQGTGAESVFVWGSVAGMPEELVAENVRLACTRLAPLLHGVGSRS